MADRKEVINIIIRKYKLPGARCQEANMIVLKALKSERKAC
jgi:hypothetical protein